VLPPFAVLPIRFPFRALAARAGRAPLGGDREVALAVLMVARLASDAVGAHALGASERVERAAAAKSWLASLAVPARVRPALARAIDATGQDRDVIAATLADLAKVAAAQGLDEPCLAELRAITGAPFVNSR
jgi:hypothetical protein